MANKKKIISPATQTLPPLPPPPPNDTPQVVTDDDTKDFLPSGWVGGDKKKVVLDYKPRKKGSVKSKSAAKVPPSATAKRPIPKQGPKPSPKQLSTTNSLDVDLSSLSIMNEGATTTMQTSTSSLVPSASATTATTVESKQTNVTISRLQVPASLVRQPRSAIEILQEQIKTLKREVEKKDRDVNSANQRAAASETARAKAEAEKKKIVVEMEAKSVFLEKVFQANPKRAAEMWELRKEMYEIEGQCQKATSELKKLREKHEVVVKRLSESGKKLTVITEDLTNANLRINLVAIEKHGLDMAIARLNRAAENRRASDERLQQTLRQERTYCSTLQDKNNELDLKNATVSEQLARTTSDSLAASFRVSTEVQRAIADLGTLRITHIKLRRDFIELTSNFENVKLDGDAKGNDYRKALNTQNVLQQALDTTTGLMRRKDQSIQRLKDENKELMTKRDLLGPLVQIGVDIRLRNLELARETALDIPTSDLDRAITLSGNVAAHRANGTVDAVLFDVESIPEGCIEEATKVFKSLYLVEPSRYKTEWGSRIKRVIDCRATAKTVKAVAGSSDCSHLESEHHSLDEKLSKLHDSMLNKDNFETDQAVEVQLLRLEEITEEIVDIKRSKGGRRRRSPRNDSMEDPGG